MGKPFLLLSSPRSGSTVFHMVISEYLRQTKGTIDCAEVFNPVAEYLKNARRQRMLPPGFDLNQYFARSMNGDLYQFDESVSGREEALQATHLLKKVKENPDRYFLKVMASDIFSPAQFKWLARHFDWIFSERRNCREQYLSLLISLETGKFYQRGGLRISKKALVASDPRLRQAAAYILKYKRMKAFMNPAHVLIYEDYMHDKSLAKIIRRLGWDPELMNFELVQIPKKQNVRNKIELFKNRGYVTDFFSRSGLV